MPAKNINVLVDKNSMFMAVMLILGIIFLYLSNKIKNEIQANCASDKLRNANLGVMISSVILITLSICYFIATTRCDCGDLQTYTLIYSSISFIIGIVMIVLGTVIASESKNNCETESSNSIWQLGIVIVLVAGGAMSYDIYKDSQKKKGSKPKLTEMGTMKMRGGMSL
jgi:uncharacterized membrane protein